MAHCNPPSNNINCSHDNMKNINAHEDIMDIKDIYTYYNSISKCSETSTEPTTEQIGRKNSVGSTDSCCEPQNNKETTFDAVNNDESSDFSSYEEIKRPCKLCNSVEHTTDNCPLMGGEYSLMMLDDSDDDPDYEDHDNNNNHGGHGDNTQATVSSRG